MEGCELAERYDCIPAFMPGKGEKPIAMFINNLILHGSDRSEQHEPETLGCMLYGAHPISDIREATTFLGNGIETTGANIQRFDCPADWILCGLSFSLAE